MKFRKILITGGVHGDEPSGINVAKHFQKGSGYIKGLVCNTYAIKAKKRFLETDLNRSFGQSQPISYEENKASKISRMVTSYDLIIDIHNTKALGTTCAITVTKPNDIQLKITRYFGFKRLVIMPPSGSLISQNPEKSVSIEIAMNSVRSYTDRFLRKKIADLRVARTEGERKKIEIFEYVNKVQRKTLDRLKMVKREFSNFRKLNKEQKKKLGLGDGNYYPIFLKKKEDEDIAFTLIKKIDVK